MMRIAAVLLTTAVVTTGCLTTLDRVWWAWSGPEASEVVATGTDSTEVRTYIFWTGSCEQADSTITVVEPPAHGEVELFVVAKEIPEMARGGEVGECAGTVIPATQVRYTADDGFVGTDTLTLNPLGETGNAIDDFEITVTATGS